MLTALHIQDFVLIDQVSLPLKTGLTALTGETGAGKSILLDALGLAIGGRAERGAIRQGAERGVVSATFEPGAAHDIWAFLDDNGLHTADDQIILRRVQMLNGKSRAFINDQPVSIGLLRQAGATLLEIHGQHDGQGFLTAATHRVLLDEFGGLDRSTKKVAKLWTAWREAEEALAEHKADRDKVLAEADYLRHVTKELEKLSPKDGEEDELAARRTELMAAEKISDDLAAAAAVLSEGGMEEKLSTSARRLARAADIFKDDYNPLRAALERLEAALSEIMEARSAIEDAADKLGVDTAKLEQVEERLFALRAAARKHGVSVSRLPGCTCFPE